MNMTGFDEKVDKKFRFYPRASRVHRFHLSSLGALLDVEGNWNTRPDGSIIQQWRHLTTQGRDHYVRVIEAGSYVHLVMLERM